MMSKNSKKNIDNRKIGNVNINLDFYSGENFYSDGDIEHELLRIARSGQDYTDILAQDTRWPILYHLTPLRRNLLEWYSFEPGSKVLEIGAGCGALTGLLCEKVSRVVSIELSRLRAEIIAYRHQQHDNLEIIVGNLNDIDLTEKFDYITLIGVLEYAGKFTVDDQPFHTFLNAVKKYLKPDGVMIIAIENKFGLKYWAGAAEDHTGKPFESIEGYPNTNGVRTFSKDELSTLLRQSGFDNQEYYYPMPDYKIPTEIFSNQYLPRLGQLAGDFPNYDQEKLIVFNEKLAANNIIDSGEFPFFANSFLIFCRSRG
jgi:2-polyprenyl-3-methyl-5-hydroxy-6-metoxy-1,4-benzoquinol methylase